MLNWIRGHRSKMSTGVLLATLAVVGGAKAYETMSDDCCRPGAACCYLGSPCCHHGAKTAQR